MSLAKRGNKSKVNALFVNRQGGARAGWGGMEDGGKAAALVLAVCMMRRQRPAAVAHLQLWQGHQFRNGSITYVKRQQLQPIEHCEVAGNCSEPLVSDAWLPGCTTPARS